MSRARTMLLDKVGATLSAACAVHCLLTPVMLTTVSLGALSWLASENVELAVFSVAVPLAGVALWRGCRIHRQGRIWLFFVTAVALLAGSQFFHHNPGIEVPLSVIGGLTLASAHLVNMRLCRHCPSCGGPGSSCGSGESFDRP